MGLYRMGPPAELVLALKARRPLAHFVETGTFHGETTAWAAQHFSRVTTIELSPKYHDAAVARFQAQPHVRVLRGNSIAVLRELVPALTEPVCFWLDAHWSGLDTAGRETECPLLEELAVINRSPLGHVLLIDDARLFCGPPPRPHRPEAWPDFAATVAALADGDRRYVALFEDVFVAMPETESSVLREWLADAATTAWAAVGKKSGWRRLWR